MNGERSSGTARTESRLLLAKIEPKEVHCFSYVKRLSMALFLFGAMTNIGLANELQNGKQCVILELFIKADSETTEVQSWVEKFAEQRSGIQVRLYEVGENGKPAERYEKIRTFFKQPEVVLPAIYCCNYFLTDLKNEEKVKKQLKAAMTWRIYVRKGCGHCRAAKAFLNKIKPNYPACELIYHDVITEPKYIKNVQTLSRHYRQASTSYPVMHFCNQLMIGFQTESSTGRRFTEKINRWTTKCPPAQEVSFVQPQEFPPWMTIGTNPLTGLLLLQEEASQNPETNPETIVPEETGLEEEEEILIPGVPLSDDGEEEGLLPLGPPGGDAIAPLDEGEEITSEELAAESEEMEVPLLGKLNASSLGMPIFTILVGLVDGFNPCAMWVLMFLLSLLVNLKSRAKILAVAGSFVFVSGLAYFAFMCAWLTVYQFVPYLRYVQVALGIFALMIGAIHIKDFFAFKKGISLSIPESAKPGIYQRARKIITAENLLGAIIGAVILAVLVNFIELLCTLGLPAAYTHILHVQDYPGWVNYAYLLLYNIAYMFDDALMVTIVVVTLEKHKLQETGGRWLKLISGAFIALLGFIMIFFPDILV